MEKSKVDELNERICYAAEHMAEIMSKAGQETMDALNASKEVHKEIFKVINESVKEDKSRRRFEAVACRGNNRRKR